MYIKMTGDEIKSGEMYNFVELFEMGYAPIIRIEFQGRGFRKAFGSQGVIYSNGQENYMFASDGTSLMALRRCDFQPEIKAPTQPKIRVNPQPTVKIPAQIKTIVDGGLEGGALK